MTYSLTIKILKKSLIPTYYIQCREQKNQNTVRHPAAI